MKEKYIRFGKGLEHVVYITVKGIKIFNLDYLQRVCY